MLCRLIYLSVVARNIRFQDVEEIAERSASRNAALGVSGLLLYTPSHFAQVLEGDETVVRQVYDRVKRDARHTRVRTISEQPISERAFGDWGMKAAALRSELSADVLSRLDATSALKLLLSLR